MQVGCSSHSSLCYPPLPHSVATLTADAGSPCRAAFLCALLHYQHHTPAHPHYLRTYLRVGLYRIGSHTVTPLPVVALPTVGGYLPTCPPRIPPAAVAFTVCAADSVPRSTLRRGPSYAAPYRTATIQFLRLILWLVLRTTCGWLLYTHTRTRAHTFTQPHHHVLTDVSRYWFSVTYLRSPRRCAFYTIT